MAKKKQDNKGVTDKPSVIYRTNDDCTYMSLASLENYTDVADGDQVDIYVYKETKTLKLRGAALV